MGDPTKGLYRKFNVSRTDGKSMPGEKHALCRYFVLDLDHDPFAEDGILGYARACKNKYPLLAEDLAREAQVIRKRLEEESHGS